MRRLLLLIPMIALAACSEQPMEPVESMDLQAIGDPVEKLVDESYTEPFSGSFFNPCTGEIVELEGQVHYKIKEWSNGHFRFQYNLKVTGTDGSGMTYVGQEGAVFSVGPDGLPLSDSQTTKLISKGSADNLVIHYMFHVNENGEVTVDTFSLECRG